MRKSGASPNASPSKYIRRAPGLAMVETFNAGLVPEIRDRTRDLGELVLCHRFSLTVTRTTQMLFVSVKSWGIRDQPWGMRS